MADLFSSFEQADIQKNTCISGIADSQKAGTALEIFTDTTLALCLDAMETWIVGNPNYVIHHASTPVYDTTTAPPTWTAYIITTLHII